MGELPPGPRAPSLIQTMGWWMRPISFLERNRARYGKRFTIRLLGERVVRDALRPRRREAGLHVAAGRAPSRRGRARYSRRSSARTP